MKQRITTNLWFDTEAEEAAAFYVSIFPNSRVVGVTRYPEGAPREAGTVMTVEWELDGQRFVGINGGPDFTFNEAISFSIPCADQAEIDYYWDTLIGDGGEASECGWLKDKYGVSWQVVPRMLTEAMRDPDREAAGRVMRRMLQMQKLNIAELQAAYDAA